MAGRDKLERGFRVYFDDSGGTPQDLTGDLVSGSLVGGGAVLAGEEITAPGDAVRMFTAGRGDAPVTAEFYLNDAAGGAHTILSGVEGQGGTLTLQWGSKGGAPASGDPQWAGEYVYLGGRMRFREGKAVFAARFVPQAGQAAPGWGTVA